VASVDVQKFCLFVDVKGYSTKGVTWTLDFFSIDGETADFNGVWDVLDEYLENTRFIGDDGNTYRIAITLVDSGWNTDYVYAFCARHYAGVYASKGVDYIRAGETFKLFDKGTLDRIGLPQAYHVNTTKLKDRISTSMGVAVWNSNEIQPPWFPNFPEDFRDDYFKMFEAENKVDEYDRKTNKYLRTIWKQKQGTANHGFDTYAYNLAALEIFANDFCRRGLELPGMDWTAFWEAIKGGTFIEP
jgi:phage terminase large subunit GpA-like protein